MVRFKNFSSADVIAISLAEVLPPAEAFTKFLALTNQIINSGK